MSDQSNSLVPASGIPTIMNMGFGSFTDMVTPEENTNRRFKGRIEVPQTKGNRHGSPMQSRAGWLYVGDSDVDKGKYVRRLYFLLVAPFMARVPWYPHAVGRRSHKRFTQENGAWKRDLSDFKPVCQSTNGIFPDNEYLGTVVTDIRTNRQHTIGRDQNGEWIQEPVNLMGSEYPAVCKNCPLGQWLTIDGRKKPPPCKDQHSYAIWVLPHPDDYELEAGEDRLTVEDMGLYYITGNNGGIHDSLRGVKEGKPSAHNSGRAFPGIMHFFKPSGQYVEVRMPTEDVPPHLQNSIAGYAKTEKAKTVSMDVEAWAIVQIATLNNAPEGFPLDVGGNTPLHPVVMNVEPNGFTLQGVPNPTLVPDFNLADDMVVPDDFQEPYLEAWKELTNWEVMRNYLNLNDVTDIWTKLRGENITVSTPESPAIEDGVVEGEVVDNDLEL